MKSIFTKSVREISFAAAALALTVLVIYRQEISSGFAILPGDRYDYVIVTTLLEHWFNVFTKNAEWSNVLYFYPYHRTIAQTDAYFLIGAVYLPFRSAGLDPFLSAWLAGALIKVIGFGAMLLFCKRALKISFGWSCAAAVLFTLNNGMTIHGQRLQLSTVALAPLMSYLLWRMGSEFYAGDQRYFVKYGVISGLLYGAWCLTCFYMAWFFGFYAFVVALIAFGISGFHKLKIVAVNLKRRWIASTVVAVSWMISLTPFAWAFLPKSQEVGVRSYESVFVNTVPLEGVLQVGRGNIVFGKLYNEFLTIICSECSGVGEYYNTGFSALLLAVFFCGAIAILRSKELKIQHVVLYSSTAAVFVTWASTLRILGYSPWYFIYHVMPGAKALNVISIYQIFLAFPIIVVAAKYLAERDFRAPIGAFLFFIIAISEFNTSYLNFDRKAEIHRISSINHAPSKECEAFFVTGWKGQSDIQGFSQEINNQYAHNVSAMLIAQLTGIPTINGVASFNPPDWNFSHPNGPDYLDRVMNYSKKHNIYSLCKLDLNSGEWSLLQVPHLNLSIGGGINFSTSNETSADYLTSGWSSLEANGVWSLGRSGKISIPLADSRISKLVIKGHPLTSKKHLSQKMIVRINKKIVTSFELVGEDDREIIIPIDENDSSDSNRLLQIDFSFPDAVSPISLGINQDGRMLAFKLLSLNVK